MLRLNHVTNSILGLHIRHTRATLKRLLPGPSQPRVACSSAVDSSLSTSFPVVLFDGRSSSALPFRLPRLNLTLLDRVGADIAISDVDEQLMTPAGCDINAPIKHSSLNDVSNSTNYAINGVATSSAIFAKRLTGMYSQPLVSG